MTVPDPRHIANGREIPSEHYSDQPYIVKTNDRAWLCTMTTGSGSEGAQGQHVVCIRSTDRGESWESPIPLEPADGPEASYSVLLKVPTGRIYCLYNYNADDIREVDGDEKVFPGGKCTRVDSLGHYVFRYSDDHGKTWSENRYEIPVREFEIDRKNIYKGRIRFFWNVGRPLVTKEAAYCSLHKVGGFGAGFFTSSEGVLLKSTNILTENDPEKIEWETLPDGDVGLRAPRGGGPISEEHSYAELSDGTIYSVYRTIDGYPAHALSRDGGHTWSQPTYLRFAEGRMVKHPRAASFLWRCGDGRFLYWFHNHGGRFIPEGMKRYGAGYAYENRNPVWLSAGVETKTSGGLDIRWSEPEIALYDDDTIIRMSYPDLVEQDGDFYLSETQKDKARIHLIDGDFLETLFSWPDISSPARTGCILEQSGAEKPMPRELEMPTLPVFRERDTSRADYGGKDNRIGISLEVRFRIDSFNPGETIVTWMDEDDRGLELKVGARGLIELVFSDGQTRGFWDLDRDIVSTGDTHHLVAVIDGGPKIIRFIVDGRLQDGGDSRQFGWGRFSPDLTRIDGAENMRIAPGFSGAVYLIRIYDRALMTTEAVGNYRAGARATVAGGKHVRGKR